MPGLPEPDGIIAAAGLQPPLRHREVSERVRRK
jgi:hypothetical protein